MKKERISILVLIVVFLLSNYTIAIAQDTIYDCEGVLYKIVSDINGTKRIQYFDLNGKNREIVFNVDEEAEDLGWRQIPIIMKECLILPDSVNRFIPLTMSFVVEKDSNISNLRLIKGEPKYIDIEKLAERLPKYKPCIFNNEPVVCEKIINGVYFKNSDLLGWVILKNEKSILTIEFAGNIGFTFKPSIDRAFLNALKYNRIKRYKRQIVYYIALNINSNQPVTDIYIKDFSQSDLQKIKEYLNQNIKCTVKGNIKNAREWYVYNSKLYF